MDTLQKNIQSLGYSSYTINKTNWKFLDYQDSLKPNSVHIFDTLVGCGQFAEMYPNEVSKDKWKNAYGLMRSHSSENGKCRLSFSVIPKHVIEDIQTVRLFLNVKSTCTACGEVTEHVTIYHESKEVYCMECDYEIKQILKNMSIVEV